MKYTTIIYTVILSFFFIYLAFRTISKRRKFQVGLGDAGNSELQKAIRVHSNFAEYVPLCLFSFFLAEIQGAPSFFIHVLGISLCLGRLLHAYGVAQLEENFKFRSFGMILTFASLILSSSFLLYCIISS
jgi:uncharacterized protein